MRELEELYSRLKDEFLKFNFEEVKRLARVALSKGASPNDVIERALRPAMEEAGRRFERGEFFLAELVVAGDLFKEVMDEVLLPEIKKRGESSRKLGTVVIGTVRGDLHDIGKSIVATMLRAAGFEVIDLGVDVAPEKFVEAAKKYNADIVAMSALLTTTMLEMRNVIEALKQAGLRDKVKVIVGGAAVTEEFAREIGADGYGEDAVKAVKICKELLGVRE
ncbi:MAG: cobalamin-binding protein [Thermoprotei archaeon]|nr:MAG: cobalamin-binding protein [Thermoprotei archaeon]